jgi:hypothetical protein
MCVCVNVCDRKKKKKKKRKRDEEDDDEAELVNLILLYIQRILLYSPIYLERSRLNRPHTTTYLVYTTVYRYISSEAALLCPHISTYISYYYICHTTTYLARPSWYVHVLLLLYIWRPHTTIY